MLCGETSPAQAPRQLPPALFGNSPTPTQLYHRALNPPFLLSSVPQAFSQSQSQSQRYITELQILEGGNAKQQTSSLILHDIKDRSQGPSAVPPGTFNTIKFPSSGLGVVSATHLRASAAAQEYLHWLLSSMSPRFYSTLGGVECVPG